MSWKWRAIRRVRMFVDRLYLTALILGPWEIVRTAFPVILTVPFFLQTIGLIRLPRWMSVTGIALLLAHIAHSLYLQRKLSSNARYRRDSSEAHPPR